MSEPPITPPLQRVSQQRDYDRADLIAVTGIVGSGKTMLLRRLQAELDREGKVLVSKPLSVDKESFP
jgi:type II secretory pathway predicted ATPase ExeA